MAKIVKQAKIFWELAEFNDWLKYASDSVRIIVIKPLYIPPSNTDDIGVIAIFILVEFEEKAEE